jgi:hypothetical protein
MRRQIPGANPAKTSGNIFPKPPPRLGLRTALFFNCQYTPLFLGGIYETNLPNISGVPSGRRSVSNATGLDLT